MSDKPKVYRVTFSEGRYKVVASSTDSTAKSIIDYIIQKTPDLNPQPNTYLCFSTQSFERVLNDDEKPLELGLTLSSQEPDEWKSFLHFKIARKDLLTVKIFRRNSSEPLAFIINENSNIQKLIELIASKFPVEDIKKTFIQEQFGNEKPQIIDNQKKIIDIIKGWGDKCENYKFLYKDSNLQIKGMEDFFYKYESQKIEDVSFDEINRNIMDIVVEGNSFYLKNEGFVDDTKGNSEFIHDNLSLLDRIKKEMDDEDSQFSKYLQRSKQMIDNKIDAYLEIAVPKVAKNIGIKGCHEITTLVNSFESMKEKISKEKVQEYARNVKDLDSLYSIRVAKIQGGIIDLIKQDLGVYFFNTKNELEMATVDLTKQTGTLSFLSNPIREGFLLKKSRTWGRKKLLYLVLTPRFLHYFHVPKNKEDSLEEILQSGKPHQSLPLSIIKVQRTVLEQQTTSKETSKEQKEVEEEKDISIDYTFDIIYDTNRYHFVAASEFEMNEWIRLINLIKSRVSEKKTIQVHRVNQNCKYEYSINYIGEQDAQSLDYKAEEGTYQIQIESFNDKWIFTKKFVDFIDLGETLRKLLPIFIFPTVPKNFRLGGVIRNRISTLVGKKAEEPPKKEQKSGKKGFFKSIFKDNKKPKVVLNETAIRLGNDFIYSFLNELLVNFRVNQLPEVLDFFGINNIFLAIKQNNLDFVKYLTINDTLYTLSRKQTGKTPIHFAAKLRLDLLKVIIENIDDMKKNKSLDIDFDLDICHVNSKDQDGTTILLQSVYDLRKDVFDCLIDREDIKVDIADNNGFTPFLASFKKNLLDFAKKLVEKNCDINCQDEETKNSALHYAFINGNIEGVNFLIHRGIDLDLQDKYGRTVLMLAVTSKRDDVINKLLESEANVNIQNNNFKTALHYCVEQNNINLTNEMLQKEGDPNIEDENKETCLHFAVMNRNLKMIELLLDHKASPNKQNINGMTPLHLAITQEIKKQVQIMELDSNQNDVQKQASSLEIIKLLIEKGSAIVDTQNAEGNYPIHSCVIRKDMDLLTYLLQNKANINAGDRDGRTPLHLAALSSNNRIIELLVSFNSVVDISDITDVGSSPIHLAAENNNIEGIMFLLRNGSSINCLRQDRKSPLHLAAKNGFNDLVSLLAENGADVNLQDFDGNTPLHLSLKSNHERTSALIAQSGGYLNMINNKGQSPLQLAKNSKIKKMIKEASERFASQGLTKRGTIPNIVTDIRTPESSIESHDKRKSFNPMGGLALEKLKSAKSAVDAHGLIPEYLKIVFHLNDKADDFKSRISTRINFESSEIENVKDILIFAKKKIKFDPENDDLDSFTILYEDESKEYIIIDFETKLEEIFKFGKLIHIFHKEDFLKLFGLFK